ncbi:MAG: class I SAM-dependent methyltransferase [Methanomethylovorans sp.]|uniref:class I SAM-dependent methyltransferase n=1 Tax=Methanomethylovorans sp. TaxID=2758717 RepID=UPI003530F77F
MSTQKNPVCPVERSGSLDNRIRRWLQNPRKILNPYVKEGMTVLEVGCGPGFFTIDLARMVGDDGRVVAADLQEGMLQRLQEKIQGSEIEHRIALHKCTEDKIGVSGKFDLVFLFYMVHEVPNKKAFFNELSSVLKTNGKIYMVEPPFHVSKKDFEESILKANLSGLIVESRPKLFPNKTALLKKI